MYGGQPFLENELEILQGRPTPSAQPAWQQTCLSYPLLQWHPSENPPRTPTPPPPQKNTALIHFSLIFRRHDEISLEKLVRLH